MVETEEMEPLLLVEDKTELRAMLRKALERAGYAVDEAPDGAGAIQKVRARRYLLVLTDLKMPGARGWTFCGRPSSGCHCSGILLTALRFGGRSRDRHEGRRVRLSSRSRWTWNT